MAAIHLTTRAALAALALTFLTGCPDSRPLASERQKLEQVAAASGKRFVLVPYAVPGNNGTRSVRVKRQHLADGQLYLRDPKSSDYLLINDDGHVSRSGEPVAQLKQEAELLFAAEQTKLFIDGKPVAGDYQGWQTGWLTTATSPPEVENTASPLVDYVDAFTRTNLTDGNCRIETGNWELRKRGGGMPTTVLQAEEDRFQRAVNPFSARGSGNGRLSYGDESWIDCRGAASFYFGIPRQEQIIDRDSLPVKTDMLVMWGSSPGPCLQFGWIGGSRTFTLRYRDPADSGWQVIDTYSGPRPAVSNWFRLELVVAAGYRVSASLDGLEIFTTQLPARVGGPFSVCSGSGEIEFDDIAVRSLALNDQPAESLLQRSNLFALKRLKDSTHDPKQFLEWARGAETFVRWEDGVTADGIPVLKAMTRLPFVADFEYLSDMPKVEETDEDTAYGTYRFSFVPTDSLDIDEHPAVDQGALTFTMQFDERGWSPVDLPAAIWPPGLTTPHLEFRRCAKEGQRIGFKCDGVWRHLKNPLEGAVRVLITFTGEKGRERPPAPTPPRTPYNRSRPHPSQLAAYRERMERYEDRQFAPVSADHHRFSTPELCVELFEKSPVDWAWIEGAFRMDCRWACQDDWNFMACGSQGVPMVTSKRTYWGDQVHEYYVSLRPVFPWEVGDRAFHYNYGSDYKGMTFRENNGWYNRRDFDFSFCFDGKNPFSGYTVMFGTDDNSETKLLRKGRVVATTTDPQFLFPTEAAHRAVHWKWWKFTVSKIGGRVQVRLNDELMFDFEDPDPIDGGHMALWSIRNGFAVARINSTAARIGWEPRVFYVENNPDNTPWKPMPADSAHLSCDPGKQTTTAVRNIGAGFFALRYQLRETPDLDHFPVLELPLEMDEKTAVNLHIQVNGKAYVIEVAAPLRKTKSLLAPEFEKGECFQIPDLNLSSSARNLGKAEIRDGLLIFDLGRALAAGGVADGKKKLESLTLGNTSNEHDLLIGGGGYNPAGAALRVGKPRFRAKGDVQ